jgi:hypothetical protein
LKALDDAATRKQTTFGSELYDRLCLYCAFIWNMSPFSKAAAPLNYVMQVMAECTQGKSTRLQAIGMKENDIAELQQYVSAGDKLIITGRNYHQLVYRLQFRETINYTYRLFRDGTRWTVHVSPIELPISDMALVQYVEQTQRVILNILPISPMLVLVGQCPMDNPKSSSETIVYGNTLVQSGAEYLRGVICASAIVTIASNTRIGDINSIRKEAVERGTKFVTIHNLNAALKAGLTPIMSEQHFLIQRATNDEYKTFSDSFITP